MRTFTAREFIILVVTLVLVAIFAGYQFVKPFLETGVESKGRIKILATHIAQAKALIAKDNEITQRYSRLVGLVGSSKKESERMAAIVSKLESKAKEAGIHIGNMQPQKAYQQEVMTFYPVEVVVDGSWDSLLRFMYLVQSQPNYFFVNEVNIEKYADTTNSLRGRMVLAGMGLAE